MNQTTGPLPSTLSIQTGSYAPKPQAQSFTSPFSWESVIGDAGDWTWELCQKSLFCNPGLYPSPSFPSPFQDCGNERRCFPSSDILKGEKRNAVPVFGLFIYFTIKGNKGNIHVSLPPPWLLLRQEMGSWKINFICKHTQYFSPYYIWKYRLLHWEYWRIEKPQHFVGSFSSLSVSICLLNRNNNDCSLGPIFFNAKHIFLQ